MTRKLALRIVGGVIALPVILLALFLLAAWIGSSIPRNVEWDEPDQGIAIMVETNGVHTGIVMPVVSEVKDWRETFPSAGMLREDGRMPTHVAIGWGEKEVFLNVPEWSDLTAATALRVAMFGGDGLMRVGHYALPQPSDHHRPLMLRPAEYRRLVEQIEAALPPVDEGEKRFSYDSYERGARNYDALGRYTLANTCNQWVGDVLANAGVEMGLWTPLSGGVMKWIDPPRVPATARLRDNGRPHS